MKQKKSYSVVNTHKAMLLQTLNLFVNEWCANPNFISRFMKGLFSKLLPKPRYSGFIWDVSVVLKYLSTLFPLDKLSLKLLTLKVTAFNCFISSAKSSDYYFYEFRLYDYFE